MTETRACMHTPRPGTLVVCAVPLLVLAACEEVEQVRDRFRDLTPHEAYLESLTAAGLTETALGREWVLAARSAVEAPREIPVPFREVGYIPPEEPIAMGYRVSLERGQQLEIDVDVESSDSLRLFLDVFRVPNDDRDPLRPVLGIDTLPDGLAYEPGRDGDFIVRVQPELLRGGRFDISLRVAAVLAFPVEGLDHRAIQSFWGDPRDGGRRRHRGVDIFARRNTPALAASAGRVSRVDTTRLGGLVVWIRDESRGASIYYAHLDSQHVRVGQRVETGDTVGFVGNTGNAITTPPHLHFGVYARGATNPMSWIRQPDGTFPELTADVDALGTWRRMREAEVTLRSQPRSASDAEAVLDRHTPFRVLGASGAWFRVALPDGAAGYVPARFTESVQDPVRRIVAEGDAVRARPEQNAPPVWGAEPGSDLPVLGTYAGYSLVETPDGRRGWLGSD